MQDLLERKSGLSDAKRALLEKRLRGQARSHRPREPITRCAGEGPVFPLSFAQERMWFLAQMDPGSPMYAVPVAISIRADVDVPVLERAVADVVRRHETLRTVYRMVDGELMSIVLPPFPATVEVHDARARVAAGTTVQQLIAEEGARAIDISTGPLFRTTLLRVSDERAVMVITVHHIATDGWSMPIILNEIDYGYGRFARGLECDIPDPVLRYADYAAWQRAWLSGDTLREQVDYWRGLLAGAPPLELPTDRPRPAEQSHRGAFHRFNLPPEVVLPLRELCAREKVTLNMVLVAGFIALLHRWSGQDDLVVGTLLGNRSRAELEEILGYFVNTAALRMDVSGDPSFLEVVRRARTAVLDADAHQDLPFEKLVDELQLPRDLSRNPVFQVMYFHHVYVGVHRRSDDGMVSPLDPRPVYAENAVGLVDTGVAKFDMLLCTMEAGDGLMGVLEYATDLWDHATMVAFGERWVNLLRDGAARPEARVSDLSILSAEEREAVLHGFNATARPSAFAAAHRRFERQAAATPDAIAITHDGASLTYAALNARANRIARRLRALGAGPEVRVGVCLERTPDLVATLLAVWKAGAAYVPLDPAHPPLRLRAMLADARAPLVVTTAAQAAALAADGIRALCLDADAAAIAAEDDADPHPRPLPQTAGEGWHEADVRARSTGHWAPGTGHSLSGTGHFESDPSNLAYVIFTSGSTGTPKGVEVEHGAISNLLDWMREAVTDEERAGVLASTNTTFDVSVAELFDTLCNGGGLVLAGNALDLIGLADADQVRTGVMVPTAAAELLRADALPPSLATLNLAGEALPAKLVDALHATGTVRTVRNLYGPTEATVYSTWEAVEPGAETVTIGRPAANTRAYVLDAKLNPAPIGVPGELYLAGAQVARGYGARPALTAERFLPEPFGGHPGARMYRTGDRVRWRADGRLEYLGRFDTQVKVRGHRIELGEVEHALLQHPAVHEAAAAVRDGRLVAWTVAAPGVERATAAALRAFIRERLPEPMVPSAFVAVDAFPTTSSGKTDRAALPDPPSDEAVDASASPEAAGDAAAASAVEEALARIWAQVLRRERVGRDENFFELGGDSILSIQVILRAAKEGIRILPRQVFAHPTVAGLAAVAGSAPLVNAEQGPVTGPVPLTPVQAWFLEQENPDAHHWNHAFVFAAAERLEPAVLASAVDAVLAHHDALRARFRHTDAGWTQDLAAPGGPIPLLTFDLSTVPDDGLAAAIAEHGGHLQAGFDLAQGPLFRAALFECGAHRPQRVLLAAHHMVVDVVSWRPIVEDLDTAYRAAAAGNEPHLPPKTTSYAHWAARLAELARMPELRAELGWWSAAIPLLAPALPVDGDGPDVEGTADAAAVELDEEETRALLEDVPPVYGTQVNDALLAALAQAFATWDGRGELLVELEGHGREDLFEDVDASRTAGWFTAMYPVLLRAPADPGEALKSAKETLRSIPRRGVGYGMLRWIGEPADRAVLAARARPEVSFNYLGQVDAGDAETGASPLLTASGEHPGATRSPRAPRRHRIAVEGMTAGGRLRMAFHHSSAVYRPETVQRLADAYADALRAIIAHCRTGDAGGFTPSDFPEAGLDQAALDALMSRLG